MALASQVIASFGVENTADQEGGTDQDIEDVKHRVAP